MVEEYVLCCSCDVLIDTQTDVYYALRNPLSEQQALDFGAICKKCVDRFIKKNEKNSFNV